MTKTSRALKPPFVFITASLLCLGLTLSAGCSDDAESPGETSNNAPNNESSCGDGVCNLSETALTCPQDCDEEDTPVCGDGLCEAGESAESCADDCAEGPVCGDGSCDGGETTETCPDDCAEPVVCGDGSCDEGESFESCPDDCEAPGPVCGDGACDEGEDFESCPDDCEAPPECEGDEVECRGDEVYVCEDGRFVPGECPEDNVCVSGACVPVICEANSARCTDEDTVGICDFTGTAEELFDCPENSFCQDAQCIGGCEPGTRSCQGDDVVECQEDGRTQGVVETCSAAEGTSCVEGECISSCDAFSVKGGYIGCDYWGVDTPNGFGLRNVFAFVVSNIDENATANVTVETVGGDIILEQMVPPQEVATLRMPMPRSMNVNSTGITDLAFRLTTDVPINAYQFNPLQRFDNEMGVSVASNDASLMIPDSALGTEYIGAAFTQWSSYSSFLSIVSTVDDNTVSVTPSATVAAGGGVPAIGAGTEQSFILNRGDVLTLKSASAGGDLTGTIITADENIAVYGGVDCAQVPIGATYCDHIEEKLFPVQAWDNIYYATKFKTRGVESDIWRIVASEDNTTITTDPPQGNNFPVLNRGEFYEFTSTEDFKIEASSPVMVAQYMTGSSTTSSPDDGDPAMLMTVPARQYRREYVFLVPDTYDDDWITVVYPEGVTPVLDGQPLDLNESVAIGASGFRVVRVSVQDGRHEITCDEPIGLSVYGYDFNISYAYPAGLDLSAFTE